MKLLLLLISCSVCFGLNLEARGAFSKRYFSGGGSILNGGKLPFDFKGNADITNTAFFDLLSGGDIKVIKTGKYFITADCLFSGSAQMRLYINGVGLDRTTTGQSGGPGGNNKATVSFNTIIDITTANSILSWRNPSGHTNTIPGAISGSYAAHLVIFGVDNVQGSDSLFSYISYSRISSPLVDDDSGFGYTVDASKNMFLGIPGRDEDAVSIADNIPYFVSYNFAPYDFEQMTASPFPSTQLNSGRNTANIQQVGRGILRHPLDIQSYVQVHQTTFPSEMLQLQDLGGTQTTYNSISIIRFDFDCGTFYTAPVLNVSISLGNMVPLSNSVQQGLSLSSNQWTGPNGIYFVSVVFNTNQASAITFTQDGVGRLETNTQSGGGVQITSSYLMAVTGDVGVKALTNIEVPSFSGNPDDVHTPISFTAVKIGDF